MKEETNDYPVVDMKVKSVITFDGDHTLYKTPLYSEKELLKKGNG